MDTTTLFTQALGITDPWYVSKTELRDTGDAINDKEMHIHLDFYRGSVFKCPCDNCTEVNTAYDTTHKVWRHLNTLQYKTYIHAEVPRIKCKKHGTRMVKVPWARKQSGFTLLFEVMCLEMTKSLPVAQVSILVDENDTRLWRFIRRYISEARRKEDYSAVNCIGIDETSKKGHNYVTVVADLEEKKVIFSTNGKDNTTVNRFAEDFQKHNGDPEAITVVTCDMSLGFKKGISKNFPNSKAIIDKFHVIKHANEAVDDVRKAESQSNPLLKRTKYIWLKNPDNLSDTQWQKKEELSKKRLKTSRAYSMKLTLQDIYREAANKEEARSLFKKVTSWMLKSRLQPMIKLAGMIRNHIDDILNYFDFRFTNALLEGLNSIIQNVKRRARGFRNPDYFIDMIYLTCGKLGFESCF